MNLSSVVRSSMHQFLNEKTAPICIAILKIVSAPQLEIENDFVLDFDWPTLFVEFNWSSKIQGIPKIRLNCCWPVNVGTGA